MYSNSWHFMGTNPYVENGNLFKPGILEFFLAFFSVIFSNYNVIHKRSTETKMLTELIIIAVKSH